MKEQIKNLLTAKPMLPGTLEKHYNVCGKAGCRCKDKINPRKHGPYYRLSYSVKGENSSIFVKEEDAEAVKKMTENYKQSRSNIQDLSLEMIHSYRHEGLDGMMKRHTELLEQMNRDKVMISPEPSVLRRAQISCGNWKSKALKRQADLERNQVKIRDLEKSRNRWKKKALISKREVKRLDEELAELKKKNIKFRDSSNAKKNFIE